MSGKPPVPNNISVASLSNPDKDGWLTKQGGSIRTWKRRWLVLKDAKLYYFKSAKDTEVTGIIPIEAGTVCKEEAFEMRKKKHTFSIKPTNGKRIYFIFADRAEDSKAWVTKINETISKLSGDKSSQPSTSSTPASQATNNGASVTRLTETQLTSQKSTAPTSQNDSRGPMTSAKEVIPFLQDPESKVLEFWQIWFESIPTEEDLQSIPQDTMTPLSLDFGVSVSVKFEKLTWRSAGPQSGFIQKMVDFFWNVGAPEAEIDRLNDVGTLLNPVRIGSWIDMSAGGGMDGGWYFPVEVSLASALDVPDPGDALNMIKEWAAKHEIVNCVYLGRDMGAVPPRQTELRVQVAGKDAETQLNAALDAFTMFNFEHPPEAAQEIMRQMKDPGLVLSIITSSEGFVRLGILMPRPSLDTVTKIINYGNGSQDLFEKLKGAVKRPKGPNYVEFLHLKAGYGYSVYTEGFDIMFHFALAEE